MSKRRAQMMQELWGQNTDKVWSEQDVREFMNEYHNKQTLTEFLQ